MEGYIYKPNGTTQIDEAASRPNNTTQTDPDQSLQGTRNAGLHARLSSQRADSFYLLTLLLCSKPNLHLRDFPIKISYPQIILNQTLFGSFTETKVVLVFLELSYACFHAGQSRGIKIAFRPQKSRKQFVTGRASLHLCLGALHDCTVDEESGR